MLWAGRKWVLERGPAGAGGEHAVVADLVRAGRGDERHQPLQELVRLEHDLRGAVAPAVAQAVEQPAICQMLQAIRGQRAGLGGVGAGTEPAAFEEAADPADDALDDAPDLVILSSAAAEAVHGIGQARTFGVSDVWDFGVH